LAYFEIVNNVIIGYYFFGDFPNKWLWIGLFFIISSGIYISVRENIKKTN
jgi:drug/metabolite transporter (DMT)-like permease